MLLAAYHTALPTGPAPDWVHLMPAGTFRGADGRGPYTLRDAQQVIAASMAGGQLPIDENHSTDLAGPDGRPSPARGWIVEMAAREDGIWGRVDWTPSGQQIMAEKSYRGISPVFTHSKAGEVQSILRAALTNTPNLTQLTTLHTRETTSMDLAALRAALGLAETADEAAILAAVQANAAGTAAHAQQAASVTRMAAQVVELQTQLATLQAEGARARAVAFVDGAIRAGKPINPLRDHFIARHMAEPAAVETEIGALPSIHAGGIVVTHAAGGADMDDATADEKMVAQKMGIDPKKLAEERRKRMADGKEA